MPLRAVPTHYRGYTFRSRLEGRWAVFFTTLGVKWDYEPEGYVLPDGTPYLPDFWLPQVEMYAEVKPAVLGNDVVEIGDDAMRKAIGLVEGSGYPLLILDGVPRDTNYWALWPDPILGWAWEDVYLSPGLWRGEPRFYASTGFSEARRHGVSTFDLGPNGCPAVTAARSARFGKGDRG